MFCLLSTSCLHQCMLVLMIMTGTFMLQTISVENYDVNIKFLHLDGSAGQFIRPSLEETCWIPIHDIIVNPSLYGSTVRFYYFDCDEMNCAKNWCDLTSISSWEFLKKTNKNESANKYTLVRDIARNFLEGGSKSLKMSATMVGWQRKFWVLEWLKQ